MPGNKRYWQTMQSASNIEVQQMHSRQWRRGRKEQEVWQHMCVGMCV